jgi:hypothetical protein
VQNDRRRNGKKKSFVLFHRKEKHFELGVA